MEWLIGVALLVVVSLVCAFLYDRFHENSLPTKIDLKKRKLLEMVGLHFVIQPCFRCHEFKMKLLEISPNGRSVHYQCVHCKKRMHAPAGTPEAPQTIPLWKELQELLKVYRASLSAQQLAEPETQGFLDVTFDAPAAPLPYEQSSRRPIPEAIRNEVWRRDGGQCVQCGAKQNLQFDHIIPISLGGATTAANLQILCQSCNAAKGAKL